MPWEQDSRHSTRTVMHDKVDGSIPIALSLSNQIIWKIDDRMMSEEGEQLES